MDHFYFQNWSSEKKRSYVETIIDEMLDGAGGKTTVGDVSLANSPLMETVMYECYFVALSIYFLGHNCTRQN